MTDTTLPTRIAADFVMPDGSGSVWIKTLNSGQRADAKEEADVATSIKVRRYRHGKPAHDLVVDAFISLPAEEQAKYLAESHFELGDGWDAVREKHPDPSRPERTQGMTDQQYMAAHEEWEAACVKAGAARDKAYKSIYDAEVKRAMALTPANRMQRCEDAWISRKFRETFTRAIVNEMLARAVRHVDDHSTTVYKDGQEVDDLPDDIRQFLAQSFFSLEKVSPPDVPTSPGASTD